MEKMKKFFGNKLYLGLTIGAAVLLVAAVVLAVVLNAPPADLTGCTVEVKSEGGKALEGVGVYVYTDDTKANMVDYVKTDANGVATVTGNVPVGSVAVLDQVPAGYVAEETYTITEQTTKIALQIKLREQMGQLTLGDVMFDFTVTDTLGTQHTLSELLETKKAVVINLWYVNCNPCKAEFPHLVEAYEKYKDTVEVLAINPEGDSEEDIAAFVTEHGLTFPTAKGDEAWKDTIATLAYPTTIIIDRFGTVGLIHTGSVVHPKIFEDAFAYFTGDDYVQSTAENINDLLDGEIPAEVGSRAKPEEFMGVQEFEITVAPGAEYYCNVYRVAGMEMTVNSKTLKVTYDWKDYESQNGTVTLQLPNTTDPSTPFLICFTNTGDEEETYKVTFEYPEGAMENPKDMKLGKVSVEVAEGNDRGFYLTYTAEKKGELTLKGLKQNEGYNVTLYNLTTYAQVTLEEDAEEVDGATVLKIPVKKDEEVQIIVTAEADDDGKYPAVSVSFTASIELAQGTLVNPDEPVENYGFTSFSVEVGADEKKLVHIIRAVNETTLCLSDKDAYIVYNGKTYLPSNGNIYIAMESEGSFTPIVLEIGNAGEENKTFDISFYFAAGTRENPITLNVGENTIKCAAGNELGTYYSFKANQAGTLTLEVKGINPSTVLCGITISDKQTFPTVVELAEGSSTVSIELPAGARAEIAFATKDPVKQWKIPAAEITVEATFE